MGVPVKKMEDRLVDRHTEGKVIIIFWYLCTFFIHQVMGE